MATSKSRRQRQRLRQLEAALATTPPAAGAPLQKSAYTMATLPMVRTTRDMVDPIYPTQLPPVEPWRLPETFGAYNRGRLWSGYGSGVSFELLRLARTRCLLLAAIHQLCTLDMLQCSEYAQTPELLGWRAQHRAEEDEAVDTDTPAVRARTHRLRRFLEVPHPVYERSFRTFVSRIMDDYLTINRAAVELIYNQRGEVVQFRAIDGATILPTYRLLQRYVTLNQPESQGPVAWDVAARTLEHATGYPILDSEYICVMRGQIVGTFAPGEILIWDDQPLTDVRVIFPPSYAEKALEGIISWLYAFHYNRSAFSQGVFTEVMLGLIGEFQDDSFVALQEQLREQTSGLKGAWRIPLVQLPQDGDLKVIHLKQSHQEMQFAEWMSTLESLIATGVYRVSTHRLDLHSKQQEGGAMFGKNKKEYVEMAKEESFQIHSAFLKHHVTQLVRLKDPEMEFVWTGLNPEDRQEAIKIEQIEVTTYRTPNEMRQQRGDDPIDKPWADLPLNALIFQAEGFSGGSKDLGEDGKPLPQGQKPESDLDEQGFDEEAPVAKALGWTEVQL
jgi:hypothetical protein